MTHTNHRSGTVASLEHDFVVFIYGSKGVNLQGIVPKVQKFLELSMKHNPVNYGALRVNNMFNMSYDDLYKGLEKENKVYAVFDNKEAAAAFIKEVKEADFGISIIVSGLIDEVKKISKANGITPHTAQCSLGVWGKTELLPEPAILDITTMCGHAMVSFNLVRRMAEEVKHGRITLKDAGAKLAKPCRCGVFNPKRAEEILKDYIATSGAK